MHSNRDCTYVNVKTDPDRHSLLRLVRGIGSSSHCDAQFSGRSVSGVIISRQIADDSCHWLLMTFIIKIPYGEEPKEQKGEITPMMNGPFIFKTDIGPTRLLSVNIAFQETL